MPIRRNAHFSFNGTDISSDTLTLDVPESVGTSEATVMSSNTRISEAALLDWSISGTYIGAAGGRGTADTQFQTVDATEARTAAIVYRNDAGAKSTTNAEWTGTALLSNWSFGGATGDRITWNFTLSPASALTRATS